MYLGELKFKGDRSVTPYSPNRAVSTASTDFDDLAEKCPIQRKSGGGYCSPQSPRTDERPSVPWSP